MGHHGVATRSDLDAPPLPARVGVTLDEQAAGFPKDWGTSRPAKWPVFICLLGSFRLLKTGQVVALRTGGKVEQLLSELALRSDFGLTRDELVAAVWSESEPASAGHALHSMLYSLHRQLGDALGGDAPVVHDAGRYRLNLGSGVGVDIAAFDATANAGDAAGRGGDTLGAMAAYADAALLYRGELWIGSEVRHVLEGERLRVRYLTLQAALATYFFAEGNFPAALARSLDLLTHEPCREDAHRLAMRCYVKLGDRAQALRQYQICRTMLRAEFEAEPEAATTTLYDQVRLSPEEI